MADDPLFRVGQWVCAMHGGVLVYSVIRYLRPARFYPHELEYVTDHGTFAESQIQEAR